MKNFCYMCLLLTGVLIPAAEVRAQIQSRLSRLENSLPESREPRFIDNIEITGGASASEAVPASVNTPVLFQQTPALINTSSQPIEQCVSVQFKYALMLNREVESVSNISLFRFIDEWWGTRYRYGGHTRKGIDCSAFAGRLYMDVYGKELPRTAREQFQYSQSVSKESMQEGDLVFFNTRGGVSHVGVYLGNGYFVHSSTNEGVTISRLEEDYYKARFIAAGRLSSGNLADACVPGQLECQD